MYKVFTSKTKTLKPFIKPFLLLFAVYCLAIFTIIRSNYLYIDDAGRAVAGYAWTGISIGLLPPFWVDYYPPINTY